MNKFSPLLSLLLFSFLANSATVSIRSDEWFPMNAAPGATPAGYMIDFANEIFTAAGHQIEYKMMPWERAVDQVREGNFDCVIGAYTDDAPDFIFPKESWGTDVSSFYVKAGDSWRFDGDASLKGKKIGIISGYSYGDKIDSLIESKHASFKAATGNDALEKNFKKLNAGRLDIVIESQAVGAAKVSEMGLSENIVSGGEDGNPTPLFIACSPNKASSQEYIDIVDKGTKQLRESGKLQQILSVYGLSDWK
ncbi:transporter substrate-binding domain-containing protein [Shewanella eurypsychrophilus]|uniref:Transporter substrate-binding domain-containing protein n=1 Tax=Shewanella eurypsychrophilus TaxID=2593656 RepID=A0ABX6V8V9_9GAMM|nr:MULTISPECIES: transporter substrate-binding domain-containing protein [Shewanella]QFU22981.1 transporter substrate-binding domain-containing protein [Shewanella sp. YLB-09]QPG58267.1 transporter substrate-binding domain-containing protein [Shewanella eurypsychrophilus]